MLASCPGGNCTLDDFSSLAACTSYVDVSDHLSFKDIFTHHASSPLESQVHLTPDHYIYFDDQGGAMMNASSVATSFWEDGRETSSAKYISELQRISRFSGHQFTARGYVLHCSQLHPSHADHRSRWQSPTRQHGAPDLPTRQLCNPHRHDLHGDRSRAGMVRADLCSLGGKWHDIHATTWISSELH